VNVAAFSLAVLSQRQERLEKELGELRGKDRNILAWIEAFSPLISGIAVVIVGFFLTGSINTALKERELDLTGAKEMRELIQELATPPTEFEAGKLEATAYTLAAFGKSAVLPLLAVLDGGQPNQIDAAVKGLRIIGIAEGEAVCESLVAVIRNRSGLYRSGTHLEVTRVLGDLGCQNACEALSAYEDFLTTANEAPEDVRRYRDEFDAESGEILLKSVRESRRAIALTIERATC